MLSSVFCGYLQGLSPGVCLMFENDLTVKDGEVHLRFSDPASLPVLV